MIKPFKVRPGAFSKTYSSAHLSKNKQNMSNLINIQQDSRNSTDHGMHNKHGYQSEQIGQDNYNFPLAISVQKQRKSLMINRQTNASINKKNQKLALKFQEQKIQKQQKQIKQLKDQIKNLQKNQKLFDQKLYSQQQQIQDLINQNKILNIKIQELEESCKCNKFSQTIKSFIYWIMKLFSESSKYMQKTKNRYEQSSIQYKYKNFISYQLIQMFKRISQYIEMFGIKDELMRIAQKQSTIFTSQQTNNKATKINSKPSQQTKKQKVNIKTQLDQQFNDKHKYNNVNINMNSIFTEEDILQNKVISAEPQNLLETFNFNQLVENAQNIITNSYLKKPNQINEEDQQRTNQLFQNVSRKLFTQKSIISQSNPNNSSKWESQIQTPQLSQYQFYEKQNQNDDTYYEKSKNNNNFTHNEKQNIQNQFISHYPLQLSNSNSNLPKKSKFNQKNINNIGQKIIDNDQNGNQDEKFFKQSAQMQVCEDYNSQKDNHIKVQKGQKVKLLRRVKNGLWIAECGDRLGYIPQNILSNNK